MGSTLVNSGITVTWDDAKHNQAKKNLPRVRDGGRYKNYKKGDLKSNKDQFAPERVVVDLKLDLGDSSVPYVTLDDVHLQITYSGVNPSLGWWDRGQWWQFDAHDVTYAGGVVDIKLPSSWPTDPPIGSAP